MSVFDYYDNLKIKIGKKLINSWVVNSIVRNEKEETFFSSIRMSVYNFSLGFRQITMLYTAVSISCKERNWFHHEDKFINIKARKAIRYDTLSVNGDYTKIAKEGSVISLWSLMPWATMDYKLEIDDSTLITPHDRKAALDSDVMFDYSLAPLETNGTITIDKVTEEVSGISWLERSCEKINERKSNKGDKHAQIRFLSFDGDAYYINYFENSHEDMTWVDHTSGDDTVSMDCCTLGYFTKERWLSPETGQIYPVSFDIRIPEVGLECQLEPILQDQEAKAPKLHDCRYFGGLESDQGICTLEITGLWAE